jgi:hypothetical protein
MKTASEIPTCSEIINDKARNAWRLPSLGILDFQA